MTDTPVPPFKAKRKVADYAGLAALITAVGATLGMFWNQGSQSRQASQSAKVQDSSFVVQQYRMQRAEQDIDRVLARVRVLELELARLHGRRPPELPLRSGSVGVKGAGGTTGGSGASDPSEPLDEDSDKEVLVQKVKSGKIVKPAEIRKFVQRTQGALKLEDLTQ